MPGTRGGKRAGAGRPPVPAARKTYSYRATEQEHEIIQLFIRELKSKGEKMKKSIQFTNDTRG